MLIERPVDAALKELLVNNTPFSYAHLIKFERPSRPDINGTISTSKERYTYLTDASRDVIFDDGSTDVYGASNGPQTYIANKVLSVGTVYEASEAKPSNTSIKLDGSAIGAQVQNAVVTVASVNASTWDVTFPSGVDLVYEGFREGDKIDFNSEGYFNIESFRVNNVVRLVKIDDTLTTGTRSVNVYLSSEEIKSILLDKTSPDYNSFINREVYIYRGYFVDGQVVGSPFLLFKGIISNVNFDDDEKGIEVTWGLTNHWGDFSQVRGRITSDEFHRALDQNSNPQPSSALKPEYAYDRGFSHSDTAINILAKYSVQVEKQDIKVKKGFLGIGSKVKVKKYYVAEDRFTDLDLQLQAKTIPIVYGVRSVEGIPVFADTKNDNSAEVYVIYVISEGEISSIYDFYIEGNSMICNNKADYDSRHEQNPDNTVEYLCLGRSDRGDVLGGAYSTEDNILPSPIPTDFTAREGYLKYLYEQFNLQAYYNYVEPTVEESVVGAGIVGGQSFKLTDPQEIIIDVYTGTPTQKAPSNLVEISEANNFKIQNEYWTPDSPYSEYFGPDHRLIDTAYVVTKVVLKEGETTLPSLEFIVRGKIVNCYNYDYSYRHYDKATSEDPDNFLLGDIVDLYDSSDNLIDAGIRLIDKWTTTNYLGAEEVKFRFNRRPDLNYSNDVPTVTKFYMKKGANTWTMITYNHQEIAFSLATSLSATITSTSVSGSSIRFNYTTNSALSGLIGNPLDGNIPTVSIVSSSGSDWIYDETLSSLDLIKGTAVGTTSYTSKLNNSTYASAVAQAVSDSAKLYFRDIIKLNSSASSVNDFYKGYIIEISRIDALKKKVVQQKEIIAYNGTSKIAVIDGIWDIDYYPTAGDNIVIKPKHPDGRSTINLPLQLMDYIGSDLYGLSLKPGELVHLPSWLESARKADIRSDVTVLTTNTSLSITTVDKTYRYTNGSRIVFEGVVNDVTDKYVTFTDVIGKLTNKWNSWKAFQTGDYLYTGNNNEVYLVTAPGVYTTEPTHTTGTVSGLTAVGSIDLVSIDGGATLHLDIFKGNPVQALRDGVKVPGYSLYDCDEVNYHRLLGWDNHEQREVTTHQGNLVIDTAQPVLENVNSMLEHFGGIIRYSSGLYYLDVEDKDAGPETEDDVRYITKDDIIGKIRLTDEGTRSAYNSLTASFADPGNKYEARNISFFNSTYLKIDRNVPKKGNLSVPGITNYNNTRQLADRLLTKSRFGLNITFTMVPKGVLLLTGTVIAVDYPRYGWAGKKFRVVSMNLQSDTLVDVVAEEYDDSFYSLNKLKKSANQGPGSYATPLPSLDAPYNLTATSEDNIEGYSNVVLSWENSVSTLSPNMYTELYSSSSPNLLLTLVSVTNSIFTTNTAHNLYEGAPVIAKTTVGGITAENTYYVSEVVSNNSLKLTQVIGGSDIVVADTPDFGAIIFTGVLIATLPIPTNSYKDPLDSATGQIINYYWARHRVIKD